MSSTASRLQARQPFAKVARRDLAQLHIVTDHCPQAALRVLGLLVQLGQIPLTINLERRDRSIKIAIEMENPEAPIADTLLRKVEAIVAVRTARWSRAARI